tara:strand:+ start:1090 stop:1449 length:360 start_codon:yes stop_codon:yes gene_type:complete
MKRLYAKLVSEKKKLDNLEKQFNEQKKLVNELKQDVLVEMEQIGTTTYNGDKAVISVTEHEIPVVEDWNAFYAYIYENNAIDLLQRRVTSSAWKDRRDDGEHVAGVDSMKQQRLRISFK